MTNPTVCMDVSDAVELNEDYGLYLKPIARINVSVQLPQLKCPGKTISNWEVMEKIKNMIKPHIFTSLKVTKSTLEFIRLEGEAENKAIIKTLISRLDSKSIKLSGFSDILRVRSAEAKIHFPTRHDMASYFRDAKNINEMKPGERPDTVYFKDLPTRWFSSRADPNKDRPSQTVLNRVFAVFGEIRCIDIPILDPYRKQMLESKPGTIQTFSFGQDLTFEAYIQYKEYVGFIKAMDSLRGMKLMYKSEGDKALTANIKVDFDKTKHLSEKSIRKRKLEREKLEVAERERIEREKKEKEEEERRKKEERRQQELEEQIKLRKQEEKLQRQEERRRDREDRRREKQAAKRKREEEEKMNLKLAKDERKLLVTQRKLDSLRLMTELFKNVKVIKLKEDEDRRQAAIAEQKRLKAEEERLHKLAEEKKKVEAELRKQEEMKERERVLRGRLLQKRKAAQERQMEENREELRKKLTEGTVRLKSAVVLKR